jgi:hypothetical protein
LFWFFYDILIYSRTDVDHYDHLQLVLQTLRENKLFAKLSKCGFGQQQMEYLGHIISQAGVATDPEKIKAVQEWPEPLSFT